MSKSRNYNRRELAERDRQRKRTANNERSSRSANSSGSGSAMGESEGRAKEEIAGGREQMLQQGMAYEDRFKLTVKNFGRKVVIDVNRGVPKISNKGKRITIEYQDSPVRKPK